MSNATLTSLAMLKVNFDQGRDYLDYLRPFVLQVLVASDTSNPVTVQSVTERILEDFGLAIPSRTVEIVIKRITKTNSEILKKSSGAYHISGSLPEPMLKNKQVEVKRHIDAVVSGLVEYSKKSVKPLSSPEEAIRAVCAFLSEFDIQCLDAYLRGTAIPNLEETHSTDIVIVSKYVINLQQSSPERFNSFLLLVQGHMLANALLCPDLLDAPQSYKGVTFYLDTPLLVQSLGLEGITKQEAANELIRILCKLGGKIGTFSHSRDELLHVLNGAAHFIDLKEGRGQIVMEARRKGTTKSDLLLLAGQIDEKLIDVGINVLDTPQYSERFQIDESAFERDLGDEVSYFNERAKEYDINSVRSIYEIRKSTYPTSIEMSQAILVTSNSAFARAAWTYGKSKDKSNELSSVITDFSLANVAWLKAPMVAPKLPQTEILSICYAALQPPQDLLNRFLTEIDKLNENGKISSRDHQILRSSPQVDNELMNLTLGEEAALNEETITITLERISSEIKREESELLDKAKADHRETQDQLSELTDKHQQIEDSLFQECDRWASRMAWGLTTVICVILFGSFLTGLGIHPTEPLLGKLLTLASVVFVLITVGNILFGTTVKSIHSNFKQTIRHWLLRRAAKVTGVNFQK